MTTLNLIIAVILYAFFDMSEETLLDDDEVSTNYECCIQNEELCVKNEEICI